MAVWQVRVSLPYTTGLPRDVSVNTWNLVGAPAEADSATFDLWRDRFAAFFNDAVSGTSISQYIAPIVSRTANACRVDFFRILDLSAGTMLPIAERTFTLGAAADTNSMPLEVAICTSLQSGERIAPSGRPLARRQGRLFLGPWGALAVNASGGSMPKPLPALLTRIASATKTLVDAGDIESDGHIAVWSRADGMASEVTKGWVDNAWDTQRRREVDATARTTWVAA